MSSTFYQQYNSVQAYDCVGCLASRPYMCEECQAYLYGPFNFNEFLHDDAEAPNYMMPPDEILSAPSTGFSPTLPLPSREAFSIPDLATDILYGKQTGLSEVQLTTITTASHPRYLSPSANGSETSLPASAVKNTRHMPGLDLKHNTVPNDTYQSPSSSSPATDIAEMQRPTPQADQFRQFRCDHPSKHSPVTICGISFTQNRDLGRHVRSVHALEDEPVYQCRCSYKSARKDNYMRHLRRCTKGHELHTFICICGLACGEKMDHVAHLGLCGGRK